MQRLGNVYQLTSSIAADNGTAIEVQKDNVVVDGAGYTLQGQGTTVGGSGIDATGENNVTIENCLITNFIIGINAEHSANLNLIQNNITTYTYENGVDIFNSTGALVANNTVNSYAYIDANQNSGIYLRDSSNSTVSGNTVVGGWIGISLEETNDSIVSDNSVTQNQMGIQLEAADGNLVVGNHVFGTVEAISAGVYSDAGTGIVLYGNSDNNQLYKNSIANNGDGLNVWFSSTNNLIYDNRFQNNTQQVNLSNESLAYNSWDNGTLGNYWSDYQGHGTYVIDGNNIDHHPLTQTPVSVKAQTLLSALPIASIALATVSVAVAVLLVLYLSYYKRQTKIHATLPGHNMES
jgi:parallel beta-helix repeat protein